MNREYIEFKLWHYRQATKPGDRDTLLFLMGQCAGAIKYKDVTEVSDQEYLLTPSQRSRIIHHLQQQNFTIE